MPLKISDFCGDPGFPAKSKIWQGKRGRGKTHPHPSTSSGQALTSPFKGEEFYRIKVLILEVGICLEFSAWDLGFPLRGVSASCFASKFCSCLIHQAQLPNKLGNYIFKLRLTMTEGG